MHARLDHLLEGLTLRWTYSMHPQLATIVFLCSFALPCLCWGQLHAGSVHVGVDTDSWERTDLSNLTRSNGVRQPSSVFEDAVTGLIGFYQQKIGSQSIDRCPFWPSCSNFALQAIHRHGVVLGICYFIDRNLYRENPGVFQRYGLARLSLGRLKLDDRFFLGDNALQEISAPTSRSVAGAGPGK